MRRTLIALSVISVCGVLAALEQRPEPAMASAASALLAALDDGQRAAIRWPFDSEERLNWHFIPRARQGLSFRAMTEPQRRAALALLRTGLSEKGYEKAETIRSLEDVLRAAENSATRDTELYFFTIFGDPGSPAWGWRYEGHHISQNWTIVNGRAIGTSPAFLGANPAAVRDGPRRGTRPLAAEEDLARELLRALTAEQRAMAVTAPTAPRDILTGNSRVADRLEDAGLVAASMTGPQQGLLMSLVEEHAGVQTPMLAAARLAAVKADGLANIRFAWMGPLDEGQGHYYRIQGRTFLIEYDNTQSGANHQHIVWRSFDGDFGTDLLSEHYRLDPHHAAASHVGREPR